MGEHGVCIKYMHFAENSAMFRSIFHHEWPCLATHVDIDIRQIAGAGQWYVPPVSWNTYLV